MFPRLWQLTFVTNGNTASYGELKTWFERGAIEDKNEFVRKYYLDALVALEWMLSTALKQSKLEYPTGIEIHLCANPLLPYPLLAALRPRAPTHATAHTA